MVWVGGSVCVGEREGERAGGGEEGRRRRRGSFDFDPLGWAQEWEGRAQEKLLREHSGNKQGNTEERRGKKGGTGFAGEPRRVGFNGETVWDVGFRRVHGELETA